MKIVFWVFLLSFSLCFAEAKPQIAVLTFEGDANSTTEQLGAITDRFQQEVISSNLFKVLDRTRIQEILKEQGFQSSGSCDEANCQVQMGKLLGVEKIISGKVVRFGQEWALSMNVTNVGTGEIEKSSTRSVQGELVTVLKLGCKLLAADLVAHVTGVVQSNALADNYNTSIDPGINSGANNVPSKKSKWVSFTLLGLAAIAGGIGFVRDGAAADDLQKYQEVVPAEMNEASVLAVQSKLKSHWENFEEKSQQRNILYGAAGALASASFVLLIAF